MIGYGCLAGQAASDEEIQFQGRLLWPLQADYIRILQSRVQVIMFCLFPGPLWAFFLSGEDKDHE
jgi:hypothetical protein